MAQVNGILKGAYYGTISDQISITSLGEEGSTKYRAIIDYKDEVSGGQIQHGAFSRFPPPVRLTVTSLKEYCSWLTLVMDR